MPTIDSLKYGLTTAMLGSEILGPSVFLGVYCIFVKRGSFLTIFGTRGVT